jgi:hypothetical protein
MPSPYLPKVRTLFSSSLLFGLLAWSCGGALEAPGGGFSGDGGAGGAEPSGGTGGSALPTGGALTGGDTGTGGTGYVDPDCPDDPPEPTVECDPLAPYDSCDEGYACYPYLEYPYEGCGYAAHGALCGPIGSGSQGDSCEYSQCSPGFLCIVGTGAGARCAKLCPLEGDDGCPPGLLCAETDVPGYGVCS